MVRSVRMATLAFATFCVAPFCLAQVNHVFGNEVHGASMESASSTNYLQPAPEPAAFAALAVGVVPFLLRRSRSSRGGKSSRKLGRR